MNPGTEQDKPDVQSLSGQLIAHYYDAEHPSSLESPVVK